MRWDKADGRGGQGYAAADMSRRSLLPLLVFLVCSVAYVLLLGERVARPTANNHFVHLAESFLAGQLNVIGNRPPGNNDWALYNGNWYVAFPPFPALLILPAVAIWGTATRDALFWAICAGVTPTLLFILLRRLCERGVSARSVRENLLLTGLFAFGTVYFFVAVQGTVWFAAQVVACLLMMLFLLSSLEAEHPLLAGAALGALWTTRPPTLLIGLVFLVEVLRKHRKAGAAAESTGAALGFTQHVGHPLVQALRWVRGADPLPVLRALALFAVPALVALGIQLWLNAARFDDPLSFGYEYLQIRWKTRIETWGLFSYHYFSKNLAVFAASLPWFYEAAPYVKISLHGLALWFTTPNLFWLLWPARLDARMAGLYGSALLIALLDLAYQNSGWIQFGYRFALDYMPLLVVLLALGGRRFGPVFVLCALFAVIVNTFGALTFERAWQFYDNDGSQNRLFQPD
jgi:hypothetical protein